MRLGTPHTGTIGPSPLGGEKASSFKAAVTAIVANNPSLPDVMNALPELENIWCRAEITVTCRIEHPIARTQSTPELRAPSEIYKTLTKAENDFKDKKSRDIDNRAREIGPAQKEPPLNFKNKVGFFLRTKSTGHAQQEPGLIDTLSQKVSNHLLKPENYKSDKATLEQTITNFKDGLAEIDKHIRSQYLDTPENFETMYNYLVLNPSLTYFLPNTFKAVLNYYNTQQNTNHCAGVLACLLSVPPNAHNWVAKP